MSSSLNPPDIHTIRLHGPWKSKVLATYDSSAGEVVPHDESQAPATTTQLPREHRLKIPCDWSDWLGVEFRGLVQLTRNFNRPSGLDESQSVWLVVEQVDFFGRIFLNDKLLGEQSLGGPDFRAEINSLIQDSNLLKIELDLPANADRGERSELAGGLIGSVRLEISNTPIK